MTDDPLTPQVEEWLRREGWQVLRGPYLNTNKLSQGFHVWSIKSVLSAAELKARGIAEDKKSGRAGTARTVRFRGKVVDGKLLDLTHITSSDRKRMKKGT